MKIRYFCALFLLTSCASFTPKVSTSEPVSATDSYIYGRFSIDAVDTPLAIDGHASAGLVIKCAENKVYTLRFYNSNPVVAVKVKPSTCSLKEIIFTGSDGNITSRKPYAKGILRGGGVLQNIHFSSGKAYYIGDFFARHSWGRSGVDEWTVEWSVDYPQNNFLTTTQEIKENFPNLSVLPTVNTLN